MLFLYNLGIQLYVLFVWFASVKNKKAKQWLDGRKDIFDTISKSIDPQKKYTWFHFASLGEFEQGRPVIEQMKKEKNDCSIVITFFSPSGYEVRKNYPLADHVFYLPADTRSNAQRFIKLINPDLAVFTKYEYWYHYFEELHQQQIPLFIISGIFRKEQVFFKWYGSLHRKMLSRVSHFFVQNEQSKSLLSKMGINNITISGDTRFDRVHYNAGHPLDLPEIEEFCRGNKVFVAGSTWADDEKLTAAIINQYPDWKFIIAPHEVKAERVQDIEKQFNNSVKYSEYKGLKSNTDDKQTLIIDSIGILSSIYRYGNITYIGGGFGVGIHNTLEAAAFGIPILFGPNYLRFREAVQLIEEGAAFSVKNTQEISKAMSDLQNTEFRTDCGMKAKNYVDRNTGASRIFLHHLKHSGLL